MVPRQGAGHKHRAAQARACALAGIGCQDELRHQQQFSIDILNAAIEPTGTVSENAIIQQPLGKAFRFDLGIAALYTSQRRSPDITK
jgi:hypothetical protein